MEYGDYTPTGTEAAVCADIARRQAFGIKKYGTTVAENPLSLKEWLQHALEETYDKAIYLKRAIQQIEREEEMKSKTRDTKCPTFDSDGYPTEETEANIEKWEITDPTGWITYARASWNLHYGQVREEKDSLQFITGGWSGNESIISAMQRNYALWGLLWQLSERGGLYVLTAPKW